MIVGHIGGSGESAIDTGDIQKSLRFAAGRSTYLSRTPVGSVSHTKYTFSHWVKRAKFGAYQNIINATNNGNNRFIITFDQDDRLVVYAIVSSALAAHKITTRVFRDPTAWLYIHVVYDTTLTIAEDRLQVWIGGVRETSFSTNTNPAQNAVIWIDDPAWILRIGNDVTSGYYPEGGMARFIGVSGSAFSPSDFIEFNPTINEWVSKTQSAVKAVVDAGGANSFMLDFDDGTSLTTLGYDKSSKGNNWSLNNFSLTAGSTYDWMLDVPGNSYATLNPLAVTTSTAVFSNANLTAATPNTGGGNAYSTIPIPASGDWYFEIAASSLAADGLVGLSAYSPAESFAWNNTNSVLYQALNGNKWLNGVNTAYGATWSATDVIGVAVSSTGTITFYKNNATQGAISHATSGLFPVVCDGSAEATSSTIDANFGQRPFTYTPPAGFKALCQANLAGNGTVTLSGSFTGNAAVDGPAVWLNGSPDTLTINGNAVTFGTHADRLATGFKVRSSSASYNTAGSNTFVATITSNLKNCFKYNNAKDNT